MSAKTTIAWTDTTWNPVTGCTKVSEGCRNCYASAIAERFWGKRKFTDVRTHPDRLDAPLRWKKPRRVFVNSMSDLFHDAVPDEFIDRVFAVMALAPKHTFQVLTKRPERMRRYCTDNDTTARILRWVSALASALGGAAMVDWSEDGMQGVQIPNVWLGVSCEDQATANKRVPLLLQTPAAVRFLSCEPLLGPIDLDVPRCDTHGRSDLTDDGEACNECLADGWSGELSFGHWLGSADRGIDWVIVGGESGRGHRPMNLDWARDLREQCSDAGVPFFFKQNSGPRPGQGEDALGEVVQEFPGGDSGTATAGGRGG